MQQQVKKITNIKPTIASFIELDPTDILIDVVA